MQPKKNEKLHSLNITSLVTGDITEPPLGEQEEYLLPPPFLFLPDNLPCVYSFEMGKKKRSITVGLRRGELDKKICRKRKERGRRSSSRSPSGGSILSPVTKLVVIFKIYNFSFVCNKRL